ncbi:Transferase [Sesbania bispinosa]|nr:Transferase [Sesbania bispinosa]
MEAKFQIMSTQVIKPFTTTPHHLKQFNLSFLDQISPYQYTSVLFFYSASNVSSDDTNFISLCDNLKDSLSNVLTLYYPLCGRIKANSYIDCNDAGVPFIEARVSSHLSSILEYPQVNVLKQLLPLDPYEPVFGDVNYEELVMMAVKFSKLSCGGVVLGVCMSHKIIDGIGMTSFFNAWVETTKVSGNPTKPCMEASLLFPTKDMHFTTLSAGIVENKELVIARLVFDGTSLSRLRDEIDGYSPTRVEVVTALIWKSMMEATIGSSRGKKPVRSFASHVVNIRGRLVPPFPENSIGNVIQLAVTPLVEMNVEKNVGLKDLVAMVKKAIVGLDVDYVSKLGSDVGFDRFMESRKKLKLMVSEDIQWSKFSSWTRFPLYEADFGWGKPTWVSTIVFPIRDNVILLPTRCGEGIEAWVTLDKEVMVQFEHNEKLLQHASVSRAS